MIFATACLYQNQAINLYNNYPLVTGTLPPTPENLANETALLRSELAEFYLFYTALWSVKLSILVFFRRLFGDRQRAPWLKTWWWFITGFTVASWAACLGTIPYDCLLKPLPYVLGNLIPQSSLDSKLMLISRSSVCDTGWNRLRVDQPAVELRNRHRY